MTRLIIIRHCETIDNVKGKMQGYHEDSDFTDEGRRQAGRLLKRLQDEGIKAVYCSDLGRALKTAEVIAVGYGLKPIKIKDLRECDIGDWRVLPVKDALNKWVEYYESEKKKGIRRDEIRPPHGENSFDHQKRVMKAVENIILKHPHDVIVIVGHSGTNRVIIGTFENKDPDDFYKVGQSNACINIVETDGTNIRIIVLNDTKHLKDGES